MKSLRLFEKKGIRKNQKRQIQIKYILCMLHTINQSALYNEYMLIKTPKINSSIMWYLHQSEHNYVLKHLSFLCDENPKSVLLAFGPHSTPSLSLVITLCHGSWELLTHTGLKLHTTCHPFQEFSPQPLITLDQLSNPTSLFQILYMNESMQRLSFCAFVIMLNIMSSRLSHTVANDRTSVFSWVHNILLCICTTFLLSIY
jgi:hypothetical protein